METIRTLIVDDEPLARSRIRLALEREPDVEVVGEAEDGQSAVAAANELRPDLLILDINMPGMSGFDVVTSPALEVSPKVLFVTAHDEFAVQAFEVNAVDYILKPVDPPRLRDAIARVRDRLHVPGPDASTWARLLESAAKSRYPDRLLVNEQSRMELVWLSDVSWIEAAGNYCALHTSGGVKRVRRQLGMLESWLDPAVFIRIHRSAIVNIHAIRDIEPLFQGDYLVRLRDGRRLTSSRTYRQALLTALGRYSV